MVQRAWDERCRGVGECRLPAAQGPRVPDFARHHGSTVRNTAAVPTGVVLGQVWGLVGPAEDGEGEEARAEPGVQHVLVLHSDGEN